jgi:hypothetical protein
MDLVARILDKHELSAPWRRRSRFKHYVAGRYDERSTELRSKRR